MECKMKIIKTVIHYWFAMLSVLSFLVGWGMLAHSLKPVQPAGNSASLQVLPSIQPHQGGFGNGGGFYSAAPNNPSNPSPVLRTGGS
jgi:hypothetical protein